MWFLQDIFVTKTKWFYKEKLPWQITPAHGYYEGVISQGNFTWRGCYVRRRGHFQTNFNMPEIQRKVNPKSSKIPQAKFLLKKLDIWGATTLFLRLEQLRFPGKMFTLKKLLDLILVQSSCQRCLVPSTCDFVLGWMERPKGKK